MPGGRQHGAVFAASDQLRRLIVMTLRAASPCKFQPLEIIPASGVYRVHHLAHNAVSHEITLFKGGLFPDCSKCGALIHFELLTALKEPGSEALAVLPPSLDHPEPLAA